MKQTLGIQKVTTSAHGNMFYTWAHFHPSTAFFPPSPHNLRFHLQVPEWNQFSQLMTWAVLHASAYCFPHIHHPTFHRYQKIDNHQKQFTVQTQHLLSPFLLSMSRAVKRNRLTSEGSDGRWTREATDRQSSPADGTELNKQPSHKWKGGYMTCNSKISFVVFFFCLCNMILQEE